MKALSRWLLGLAAAFGCQAALAQDAGMLPTSPAANHLCGNCAPALPCLAGNCCANDCGPSGLVGGVGLYLIQPYFESNPAFFVSVSQDQSDTFTERARQIDLRTHVEAAPQLWLGYLSDSGLGGRIRWWYFRQGSNQSIAAAPTNDDEVTIASAAPLGLGLSIFEESGTAGAMAVTSKLQLQVWDLEAMQSLQTGNWDLLFCGGLRLAHINQRYDAYSISSSSGSEGSTSNSGTLRSGHSFHGVGPTVALEARRYLGNSGLALYGNTRGALLIGNAKQNAFLNSQSQFFGETIQSSLAATDHRNAVLPVAELEIGAEYGLTRGRSRFFGQAALVGQGWFGADNASRSSNPDVLGPLAGGTVEESNLGFFGLVLRLGVNY